MAPTNGGYASSRSDDDAHDQIGSTSAPPSGVATPRPDPSDKRLPGIMHGYFGQVRERSSTSPTSPSQCALATPATDTGISSYVPLHHHEYQGPGDALPTAPSSPNGKTNGRNNQSLPLLPHEHLSSSKLETEPEDSNYLSYPTPPVSPRAVPLPRWSIPTHMVGSGQTTLGRPVDRSSPQRKLCSLAV